MSTSSPYDELGGETGVRRLVDSFYDYMDTLAEARTIRALHAKSLRGSREKLFLFLSGWLGGPDLYGPKYGHPRLRARHLPFAISREERDQWMLCMRRALADHDISQDLRERLERAFWQTANHMRNRPEYGADLSAPLQIIGTDRKAE